jgi:hypothetical protein
MEHGALDPGLKTHDARMAIVSSAGKQVSLTVPHRVHPVQGTGRRATPDDGVAERIAPRVARGRREQRSDGSAIVSSAASGSGERASEPPAIAKEVGARRP